MQLTIEQASGLLKNKEISSVELTRAVLDRIEAVDGKVGAYLTVDADGAMARPKRRTSVWPKGNAAPLTGIPLGIKDLMCTQGLRTTCASKILENFIPPYDATVIPRLKNAGAVIVGKLNMDEFAMGSTTEHSGFQVTRNPWNLDRIPGGPAAGPLRRWRRICAWVPWVRTPAVPSANPPPTAGWWESSPPTDGYPASVGGLCLVVGSDRPFGQNGGRLRPHAGGHCRTRPQRLDLRSRTGADLFRSARRAGGCGGGHSQGIQHLPRGWIPKWARRLNGR
jgi:hypothetical protein